MSRKRSIVERFLPGEECDLTRIDGEIDAWHEADTSRDQALPVMPVGEKNAPVLANRRVVKGLDSGDIDWRRLRQP